MVLPFQKYGLVRVVNRLILSASLRLLAKVYLPNRPIFWTYNPLTLALAKLPEDAIVLYHCVDNVGAQPGVHQPTIEYFERGLVERATIVCVTSRDLERRWSDVRPVHYDPNCVDADHFMAIGDGVRAASWNTENPIVGFVGAIASYKLDVDLLLCVARMRSHWSLVLVGPREDDDPEIDKLLAMPNVEHLGSRPYAELPQIMRTFNVGIIPARTGEYASSMFPMKFFEYLASGIPVVTTDLPALQEFRAAAEIVDRSEFVGAVGRAIEGDVAPISERINAYAPNTYRARTRRMLDYVGRHLEGGGA